MARLEFIYGKRNPEWDADAFEADPDGYDVSAYIMGAAKDESDCTYICATEIHPVDHHEYGLMLHITDGAIDEDGLGHHYRLQIELALAKYLVDNPDGDPNASTS
ncbi:hypothetical protein ACFL0N_01700 [Pseudomonadota bacterium]